MKAKIKIPEHSESMLKTLQSYGLGIYDYANYENGCIVGYQRWGRGFRKDIIEECDADG